MDYQQVLNLVYYHLFPYLDFKELGKVLMLNKEWKAFNLQMLAKDMRLLSNRFLHYWTCDCNICDKLYLTPWNLYPSVNGKLFCQWYHHKPG